MDVFVPPCISRSLHNCQCKTCCEDKGYFSRSWCFVKYIFWRTDPITVEILLCWLSLVWGVRFFLESAPHWFGGISSGWFRIVWGQLMIIIGLSGFGILLEQVKWVKILRYAGIVGLSFVWCFSALFYIRETGHIFSTPSVLAISALWVMIRHEVAR